MRGGDEIEMVRGMGMRWKGYKEWNEREGCKREGIKSEGMRWRG